MEKFYCVYQVTYIGNLLPKLYIGSTSIEKVNSGKYFGSISSKKWKDLFKNELLNNPQLFSIEILSEHILRTEALKEELKVQIENNVVKSSDYMNESLASVNGMFGRDANGKNNPMFGKKRLDVSLRMLGENNIAKRANVREKLKIAKIGYIPLPHIYSEKSKLKMRDKALNRSEEAKENIREGLKNSCSQEKAVLVRKIKTDEKYKDFVIELINKLKYSGGSLEINEIYKYFINKPEKFIKTGIVYMKKRKMIYSVSKGCKSLCVLN